MNITIICDVLGENNNGTTLATMNLIEHLKTHGHHVTVVSTSREKLDGVEQFTVPVLSLGKLLDRVVAKNGVTLAKIDEDILRRSMEHADVVHIQIPLSLGKAAVRIAVEMGRPVTASFHCQAENITAHLGLMNCRWVNHQVYRSFYEQVYQYCTRVHYPTRFIRDLFEEETAPTRGMVISNGVNERFFEPAAPGKQEDKFVIVCTGRYSREKAQWQLIRAVSRSRHKDQIRVVLAGDGPYKNLLAGLAERLGVDCVQQFFSREELISLLQNADLYVHTALVEIEAIACMEAIVCGLVPVICRSQRSATRYFARDEKNLFEPKNIEDLAEKIDYWLEHPAEKAACAEAYRQNRKDFALKTCMQQMEKLLCDAAAEKQTCAEAEESREALQCG